MMFEEVMIQIGVHFQDLKVVGGLGGGEQPTPIMCVKSDDSIKEMIQIGVQ